MNRRHFSPTTIILLSIIVILAILLVRREASSQTTEAEQTTIDAIAAPSGTYLSYQGQLRNDAGQSINATVSMIFELYQTLTGGSACQGWSETHSVTVEEGSFNVKVGSMAVIPSVCLVDDIYLELTINGETLSPREQLTPFANTLPDGSTTQGDLTIDGNVHINPAGGSGSTVHFANDDSIVYDDTANSFIFSADASPSTANATIDAGKLKASSLHSRVNSFYVRNDLGDVRLSSVTDAYIFIDSDNNSTGETFQVLKDNSSFGGGISELFRVDEDGDATVQGNLSVGSCSRTSTNSSASSPLACNGGSITTGAVIEANLQTQEEKRSEKIERFELGDVLCWDDPTQRLELCQQANNRLIQAVANANGKPIVLGAEPIKVLGSVEAGDLLVASDVPGYAMVNNNPEPGTVIAQALEDFNGERGIILAMIRKM